MRGLVMLSLSVVLLVSLASAQHANLAATYKGEPLLPTQGAPIVNKEVVAPVPAGDKRPVLLKWRYPATTRTAPAVAVWLSVDGGPWAEIGRTLPGALNFSYTTDQTNVTHCTYLVPVTRGGTEGKPSPTVCEYIDEISSPTDVSVQAQ